MSLTRNTYTATLPNGLRVVMERRQSSAVYCGIVVGAGTRHEDAADSGLAHCVEHLSFKGTLRRSARQITSVLERRGGELSAFTTKQETVYYASVMPSDFLLAADVLCDLVFCSTFPQRALTKEVEVICDEIDSFRDSPAELIFDDFESRLFPGISLGRDILGRPERLRQYATADLQRFAGAYYRPANCVFYVCGDIDFRRAEYAIGMAMQRVGDVSNVACASASRYDAVNVAETQPFSFVEHKDTHQAHVVVGTATAGGYGTALRPLQLLTNILGGAASNARFNIALRERAGLVYTVESYLTTYPDVGVWTTYFGCDAHDVRRCLALLHKECVRLTAAPLHQRTLQAAKRQFVRQTQLAADSFEHYALALGRTFAHYGVVRNVAQICQEIEAITADELHRVAQQYLTPDKLSTLVYER